MAEKVAVNSAAKLAEALGLINNMFRDHKYLVVSVRPGKDRTLDQNGLWFKCYERIAQMTQVGEAVDVRRYCKLHYGVPIMRRDCDEFRDGWNRMFLNLTYEEKLYLMAECELFGPDGFPVTRLFNRKQGIEYTNRMVDEFTAKGVFFADLLKEAA